MVKDNRCCNKTDIWYTPPPPGEEELHNEERLGENVDIPANFFWKEVLKIQKKMIQNKMTS